MASVTITPREGEVLRLIQDGLSTSQIAEQLSLSVNTIESHRKKLYRKLGVSRVAEALKVAKNQGIIWKHKTVLENEKINFRLLDNLH